MEQEILREGHELLSDGVGFDDYATRLANYMEKVTDLGQSDLANYVGHRRVVIDLLDFAITRQEDGKFVREDVIHELIVPMRSGLVGRQNIDDKISGLSMSGSPFTIFLHRIYH